MSAVVSVRSRRGWAALLSVALAFTALVAIRPAPATALVQQSSPISSWRPNNGIAYAQARVGDMIVLGGTFTSMRSPSGQIVTRNRLAAISATTGELLPWNPNPNGENIRTVAPSPDGSRVYVGGTFTSIGGASRTNVAALSATTGSATSFVANANATVRQIRFIDDRLFLVGTFWKVNGVNRGNGAEVDPTTGALKPWDPKVTAGLITVAGASDGIYVGGYFSQIGSTGREHVAKVDRTTGALLPWTSGSTCQDSTNKCDVWDILATPDTIYLAQGGPGGRIVSLDPATGVQRWWVGADGDFTSILREGTKLYAAGHFADAVAGVPRAGIVVLDARTGAVLPDFTTPVLGGSGVWQLLLDNGTLRASGQFSTVGSATIGKYVSFPVVADPPDQTAPQAPGSFRVPAALSDQVTLSWTAAADDVATIQYRVLRNGTQIATPSGTVFKDRSVAPGTTYTYTIEAVDGAGNVSPPAKPVTVTTEADQPRLLNRGESWRYLSLGTAPGAGWTTAGFADSSWAQGVGEFGFGDGDEDSPISPKGVAHYFRTTFTVAEPAAVKSATLRMVVDDGAVVYLNGQEIGRLNMPSGTITNDTVASSGISGTPEMVYQSVAVPVGALQKGANQLAVEVHNSGTNSSDVSFDAFISYVAQDAPQAPAAPAGLAATTVGTDQVTLRWDNVAGATSYEVRRDGVLVGTTSQTTFTNAGLSPATAYSYTVAASNAVGTGPGAPLSVTTLAEPPQAPETPANLTVSGPGSTQLTVSWDSAARADSYVVTRNGTDLPATAATSLTDTGLNPATQYTYTVRARNAGGDSAPSAPSVGSTATTPVSQYVAAGAPWRYLDGGAVAAADWRSGGFDDSAWQTGNAELGYGDGDEATVLSFGANSSKKPITYYFRKSFDAGGSVSDVTSLALRTIVDDGAVVYLNGQEIWRFNLPAGEITSTTRAVTAIAGTDESRWRTIDLPVDALRTGQNVITVEVHQDLPGSSDLSFNLDLKPVR